MKENGNHMWHHAHDGHFLVIVGVLILLYGLINYLRLLYSWPPYMGWVVGGLVLIVLGLTKKYWLKHSEK